MFNFNFKFQKKDNSGSVILLSLMIISAVLSSALYINVISIRGMRQSQNIDNSIVAFYAAESGNEQAIYYLRKVEDVNISDLIVPGGSVEVMNSLRSREISDEIKNVLISLKKDETYQLDLFEQDNLNFSSNINYLDLSWDGNCANPKIELTVNEWEAENNVSWGDMRDQMHINKCLITSPTKIDKSGKICSDIVLNGDMAYQFRFKALNCDIFNLNIKAFDNKGEQISFRNIYNINSVGEYPINSNQSNRQALNINLRKASPLSGLFDYVLFSEESLIKDTGVYTGGWFGEELFITTDSLPETTVNSNYSYTIRAAKGVAPYEWSLSGSIPPGSGFDISKYGILSGLATEPGIYPLMIRVVDSASPVADSDSKVLFLNVTE